MIGAAIAAVLALAVITFGCILSGSFGKAPSGGETAIVLGCKVNGDSPSRMMRRRLDAASSYLEKYPEADCILSGGMGHGENITEARAMSNWLEETKGIDKTRLYLEEDSTDTVENIINSKALIESDPNLRAEVAIVTNDYHMFRALRIAKKEGLDAKPVIAKTDWWMYPTFAVREMYGILEFWFIK